MWAEDITHAEKMTHMENLIGSLFHSFNESDLPGMMDVFAETARMELPDMRRRCVGLGEIKVFWTEALKNRRTVPMGVRTVYLPCNVFIEPRAQGQFYGEWDTYSFRSEQPGRVQYFLTHMQAEFMGGKITYLRWNEILELEPWALCGSTKAGDGTVVDGSESNRVCTQDYEMPGNSLTVQDYIEIRNLQGHFTHEGMDRKAEWFSKNEEVLLELPSLFPEAARGSASVSARLEVMRIMELRNGKNYIFLPMICAPVIYGDENRAVGKWLVIVVEVKAAAFGIEEPPYSMIINVGRLNQQFVKADGCWRFLKFRHEIDFEVGPLPYVPEAGMRHRMREGSRWDNTWLTGPLETGVACPDDVYDVEMMMPQWTGRIRSGNSMDFVDRYMVNKAEPLSMLVAGSTLEPTCGYEAIKARFGPKKPSGRRENPAFHTLSTPVLEFSEDGQYAKAAWTDFAIADFSGAMGFPAEPVCYYATANKYYHGFVRDDGHWKLYSFGWEPGIFMGGFKFNAEKCRGFYKGWDHTPGEFPVIGEEYPYPKMD